MKKPIFKEGDDVFAFSYDIKRSKFISDFGDYYTTDKCRDGPAFYTGKEFKTEREAIEALIKHLQDSLENP